MEYNGATNIKKVAVFLGEYGSISSLEQMSRPLMMFIKSRV